MGHLFRYLAVVQLMSQNEAYAPRNFPFSLASHSYALKWFASLPKQSLASWADLVEAFVARFNEYTVVVTLEQMQAMRPLASETTTEFVKRWLDTRLRCPYLRPEREMVQDCLKTLEGYYDPMSGPPITFADLLRQIQELELPDKMDVSCNMVNITPVEGETSESLAVLRSGKATAEEKGKEVAGPDNSGNNPVPSPSPNKPDEEGRKSQKPLEYDVIAHLRRIPARLSIYEALQLSKESREALINALVNESVRDFYLAESTGAADCAQTITFTDEDLLLGDYEHNRPLFVTGDLAGERINRILLDAGSAVNILPLR